MAIGVVVHDLPSDTPGKTWEEKNLERKHAIPLGSLVEIHAEEMPENGVRLFVCQHTRDCDGEPLYTLTWNLPEFEDEKLHGFSLQIVGIHGWGEDALEVIRLGNGS